MSTASRVVQFGQRLFSTAQRVNPHFFVDRDAWMIPRSFPSVRFPSHETSELEAQQMAVRAIVRYILHA